MRLRQTGLIIAIIFCSVVLCLANQITETKIGTINLDGPFISESEFMSQFGQGDVQINRIGSKIFEKKRIYYEPKEKVWIEIYFSHALDENMESFVETILITKIKLCSTKFKPKKPFSPVITSRGIRIDDSINKVIETYGKPSVSIDVGKDKSFSVLAEELKLQKGQVLRYLGVQDELYFAEFYFDKGSLSSLLISQSE